MGLARSLALWAVDNRWLREHLPRYRWVRRSVVRFMPGETLEDAIDAAARLRERGQPTMFTYLGENVVDLADAGDVADHYLDAYERIANVGLQTEISVKPSHLGLDLDATSTFTRLDELANAAEDHRNWLWLDMESHEYVEPTLELYRKLRAGHPNVGVCLQAYLKRTAEDVDSLMPLDPTIRLVKGAYREPREVAFGSSEVIDEAYRRLALLILARKGPVGRLALGTHDVALVKQIEADVRAREGFEVHMLFGIRQGELLRMRDEGYETRSLISYGSNWYPWFMRRIAEKPIENSLLALRNLFSRR
ncbi:MAG TPA: proline dehydrogenase family protein [Actinomycetota bacterium]|nr:proline dehydrogenase family protein [Actinomycetota bacterium]